VAPDFHPRYCDTRKTYEYSIYNAQFPNPLERLYSHFVYYHLDEEKMQEAANYLVGEHDFKSFCTPKEDVENTVRTIYYIKVVREENMVRIRINGNGFLYNMVRIIVGSLLKVGMGMIPPEEIKHILEAKDRTKAGHKAAACGLTLLEVEYL
jgi:tRNA pseudouridine38-40 synthase